MKPDKKEFKLGKNRSGISKTLKKFEKRDVIKRIWEKDTTIWKKGENYDELIKNRLGWMSLPTEMISNCDEINAFTDDLRENGFTHAVVMGMGGSSMCPEVCRDTFGIREGYLNLHILDTTDPLTILDIEDSIEIEKTIFIVSSKSGTTIEVDSFFRYFFEKIKKIKGEEAGKQFAAVTDPGTFLESLAGEKKFRKVFINPADIGGRYSALSYFGLVPASLTGVDIKLLLNNAGIMMERCMRVSTKMNPGIMLGTIAGELALEGKDKLTFFLPYELRSFGYWAEQLIAESTGKEGMGILPVEGEGIGKRSSYKKDRVFVRFILGKENKDEKKIFEELTGDKINLINIRLKDLYDIGGQFYLWEFATAVMGAVLGINPFDEPNVKESKDNTGKVLEYYKENGKLPVQTPSADQDGIKIYLDEELNQKKLSGDDRLSNWDIEKYLAYFFEQIKKGDYAAIMAYIQKDKINEKYLQKIRELFRSRKEIATTVGYGPRFLHSTGQLHKGGADNGVFVQIVAEDTRDIDIPDRPYTFGILKQSQAIGDYQSLIKHNRRVIKIDLGKDIEKGLKELFKILKKTL
ncbi:MAG TPA: hypothetical protein PKA90_03910 [Ignavibacteria bacterium]|nr:hypothetical protein [Ignavibacteria bacterium]HMR39554.1 hypothetical protein [Ignavibacteria bacterium]